MMCIISQENQSDKKGEYYKQIFTYLEISIKWFEKFINTVWVGKKYVE